MEGPKGKKMRKEFKNAKAKHGLNSKKKKRKIRQIGIRPNMALLLRPKYLLVYKNRRGELKNRWEKERRRNKEEEFKKDSKVWNYDY